MYPVCLMYTRICLYTVLFDTLKLCLVVARAFVSLTVVICHILSAATPVNKFSFILRCFSDARNTRTREPGYL